MSLFDHAFGDKRRAAAIEQLEQSMVEQSTVVVRQLGGRRSGEMSAHRVLSCPKVTPATIVENIGRQTGNAVAGCRVVAAQDTTEINFPGRRRTRLGPAGRTGETPGFFLHGTIAVDADSEAVLGLVDAEIWTRDGQAVKARRQRALTAKESYRWLAAAQSASVRLAAAQEVIVVGDRESDIYALFARRPAGTHLLVRAAQNRALTDGDLLFDIARTWPLLARHTVKVAPRHPGDPGRNAQIELRGGEVVLRRPHHGKREGPANLAVTLVEAEERSPPPGIEPLHWRLLTTLPCNDAAAAAEVVRLYRLRWRIEQCFRMLKSDGLRLEESQTVEPHRLFNLAMLAMNAAVRIIQLVDAREIGRAHV